MEKTVKTDKPAKKISLKSQIEALVARLDRQETDVAGHFAKIDRKVSQAQRALSAINADIVATRLAELAMHLQGMIERNVVTTEVGRALRGIPSGRARDVMTQRLFSVLDEPVEWWIVRRNMPIEQWLACLKSGQFPTVTVTTAEDDDEE